MRREAVNSPVEGIITDYTPLNTPNKALTDCLNGTMITYNGNEFVLQNDMGNYKLENCSLGEDFVPVGTAAYGDILYIVSYNPLTSETEIGSYPSPSFGASSKNTSLDTDLDSILTQAFTDEDTTSWNYNALLKSYQKILTLTGDNDTDLTIRRGDKYFLSDIPSSNYKYEELRFYILDSTNHLQDVTEQVNLDIENYFKDDSYAYVNWPYSGKLTCKWELPTIDESKYVITHVVPPTMIADAQTEGMYIVLNDNGKVGLTFKITVNDKSKAMFDEALKDGRLRYKLAITDENNRSILKAYDFSIQDSYMTDDLENISKEASNWADLALNKEYIGLKKSYYFADYIEAKFRNFNGKLDGHSIKVIILPYINMGNDLKQQEVFYYEYAIRDTVDLEAFASGDIELGTSLFQYNYNETSKDLNVDISCSIGEEGTSKIGSIDINFYLLSLTGTEIARKMNVFPNETINLTFNDIEEDFYVLKTECIVNEVVYEPTYRMVIASEIVNDYALEYKDFTEIPGENWISKLDDFTITGNHRVNKVSAGSNYKIDTEMPNVKGTYFRGKSDIISEDVYKENKDVTFNVSQTVKVSVSSDLTVSDKYFKNIIAKSGKIGGVEIDLSTGSKQVSVVTSLPESVTFTSSCECEFTCDANNDVTGVKDEDVKSLDTDFYYIKALHASGYEKMYELNVWTLDKYNNSLDSSTYKSYNIPKITYSEKIKSSGFNMTLMGLLTNAWANNGCRPLPFFLHLVNNSKRNRLGYYYRGNLHRLSNGEERCFMGLLWKIPQIDESTEAYTTHHSYFNFAISMIDLVGNIDIHDKTNLLKEVVQKFKYTTSKPISGYLPYIKEETINVPIPESISKSVEIPCSDWSFIYSLNGTEYNFNNETSINELKTYLENAFPNMALTNFSVKFLQGTRFLESFNEVLVSPEMANFNATINGLKADIKSGNTSTNKKIQIFKDYPWQDITERGLDIPVIYFDGDCKGEETTKQALINELCFDFPYMLNSETAIDHSTFCFGVTTDDAIYESAQLLGKTTIPQLDFDKFME